MNALIRILFPLVSYVCTATVVTTLLGYGYLRSNGKLNDEQLFRIVALLHGVDLKEIAQQHQPSLDNIPAEETSYTERRAYLDIFMRQFEAKQEDLQRNLDGFNYHLRQVNDATIRYEAVRQDVKNFLQEQNARILKEGPASVRVQLEKLDPKKQAKPLILDMVEEGRMDDVILLLGGMKSRNREAILKTFTSEKELDTLHVIHSRMMSGEPIKPKIDEAIETLNQLNEQENN
jgi:hypothetical protein